jgi:hypothetical protein
MQGARPLASLLGFVLALCAMPPARANTSMHIYTTLDRTDYVIAAAGGIGAPGTSGGGAGTLTLEGVSGTVTLALLYWNGIDVEMPELGLTGGDADYDEPDIEFDGVPFTGDRVAGSGSNDCWPLVPQPPSAALYRADVTGRVASRGSGDYTFAGLADKPGHSANGLSLIVYFDDGNPGNDLRIAHYEGMQSNTEEMIFEPVVDYAGGVVEAVLHVSDGQDVLADGHFYWIAPGAIPDLGDIELRYDRLYDNLPLWPGTSVPALGHPRTDTAAGLWDIRRMPLTPLFGPPKRYATKIRHSIDHDCVSLQVAQIVQPAGAAPSMLSPNPFDFGDVVVGATTPPQRFTLTNIMPAAIAVEAPSIGNSEFQIVAQTCEGATLQPGDACTVDVTYRPAGVIVPHDAPLLVPFTDITQPTPVESFALLRGAGVPDAPFSRVELDKRVCTYPETTVRSSTGAVHFTARNTGTLPVMLTDVQATEDDFVLYHANCLVGATLAPGDTCSVDAAFKPLTVGHHEAGLLLYFSADDAQQGYSRSDLDGNGIAAADVIHADSFETLDCSPWW